MALALGVDIGQQTDPTALALVETYRPDPTGPKDWPEQRHRVRWVERVPLGALYGQVVERIAVVAEAARTWGSAMIVLDGTGVGRSVVDLLRKRTSVPMRAVILTGGEVQSQDGPYTWHVPKHDLVTALEVVLQSRRLEVVPDCPLQPGLRRSWQPSTSVSTLGAGSPTRPPAVRMTTWCWRWRWRSGGAPGEARARRSRRHGGCGRGSGARPRLMVALGLQKGGAQPRLRVPPASPAQWRECPRRREGLLAGADPPAAPDGHHPGGRQGSAHQGD